MAKRKTTCIILGAGASYGASFQKEADLTSSPPTMAKFLRTAKTIVNAEPSLKRFYASLVRDFKSLTGKDLWKSEDLEDAFRVVEAISPPLWTEDEPLHDRKMTKANVIKWHRQLFNTSDKFISLIVDTLETCLRSLRRPKTCTYHDKLVRGLYKGDTIISLNYDTLVEQSLLNLTDWRADERGYGLPKYGALLNRSQACSSNRDLMLLKIHGSLNWFLRHTDEPEVDGQYSTLIRNMFNSRKHDEKHLVRKWYLEVDNYCSDDGSIGLEFVAPRKFEESGTELVKELSRRRTLYKLRSFVFKKREEIVEYHRPAIIPPTSFKNLESEPVRQAFRGIWKVAFSRLNHADNIVIIGSKVSLADVHFRLLLRDAVLHSRSSSSRRIISYIGREDTATNLKILFGEKVYVKRLAGTLAEWYKNNRKLI